MLNNYEFIPKRKKHKSLRYYFYKFWANIYWLMNADKPWLTKEANLFLQSNLNKNMIGLEFGSGRSTLFFAKKVKKLISVENNMKWYKKIKDNLKNQNITNVELKFVPILPTQPEKSEYYKVPLEYENECFDFVLIDGKIRDLCTLNSLDKLKPCGALIIDNINWFIPGRSNSDAIPKIVSTQVDNWRIILNKLAEWQQLITSNKMTYTAIFIKPSK